MDREEVQQRGGKGPQSKTPPADRRSQVPDHQNNRQKRGGHLPRALGVSKGREESLLPKGLAVVELMRHKRAVADKIG